MTKLDKYLIRDNKNLYKLLSLEDQLIYRNNQLPEKVIKDEKYKYKFFSENFYMSDRFFNSILKPCLKQIVMISHLDKNTNLYDISLLKNIEDWNDIIYYCDESRVELGYGEYLLIFESDLTWGYYHMLDKPSLFFYKPELELSIDFVNEYIPLDEAQEQFYYYNDDAETERLQDLFKKNYMEK